MARKIDLSTLKQEDIPVISLTGVTYLIPGNFSTEYAITLLSVQEKAESAKAKNDVKALWMILKQWVYELISMNIEGTYIDDDTGEEVKVTHKKVTKETIDREFNDIRLIEYLLAEIGSRVATDFGKKTLM